MSDDSIIFGFLILYKVACLIVGLGFAFMGYRLFLEGKLADAGDLNAESSYFKLVIHKGAPGTFFCVFGAILILFSIFKGVEYSTVPVQKSEPESVKIIPNSPPFHPRKIGES
jgi:hypothetical protein